jgi:ribosomal protein L35
MINPNPFAKSKPKRGVKKLFEPASAGAGTNKFSAKRAGCAHGHTHASRKEARRCNELNLLERAGEIMSLEQQPRFRFVIDGRAVVHSGGRQVYYTADFSYLDPIKSPAGMSHVVQIDGKHFVNVVEDVKGSYRDDTWTLRKAFFRACFPQYELREV